MDQGGLQSSTKVRGWASRSPFLPKGTVGLPKHAADQGETSCMSRGLAGEESGKLSQAGLRGQGRVGVWTMWSAPSTR